MALQNILANLGLSAREASTYLSILQLGRTTIKPISDRAGVKRTSIYNFIDRLVELGLVTRTVVRGRNYYEAKHPTQLLELQKSRLRNLEELMPELLHLYGVAERKPEISYFEGPDEIKNIVLEETRCKKEARYIWPGKDIMEMIGGAAFMTSVDKVRIAKKVRIKTVRFKQKDVPFETSAHGEKYLRELRFAPPSFDVSMGLGIYDTGKVGFFSSKKEAFGIMIESHELMQLMGNLYEFLWQRSIPARTGEG